jgi:hypothetical protein
MSDETRIASAGKTVTILYWVFTILFSVLMIFSALGGLQPRPDTIKMLHDGLGYPVYFIQFLSIAKLLGAIAILIPGLYKIKEWAYAGLFFDLVGAVYSGIAVSGFAPKMLFMLIWFLAGILSYYYWSKKVN